MADSKVGRICKVTIGATNEVLGMGTWEIGGGSCDTVSEEAFGSDHELWHLGIMRPGTVSFTGLYKKDDTTGQDMIVKAYTYKSDLTTIRFWVDATSYYIPNSTTNAGGGLPADTPVSHINIVGEPAISVDMGGMAQISFSGKIYGLMRLC